MGLTYVEEAMLRSAVTRAAVVELVARQNRACESGDASAWLSGFSPVGVLERSDADPLVGHAQLRSFFDQLPRGRRYLVGDSMVTVDRVDAAHDYQWLVLAPAGQDVSALAGLVVPCRDELVYERGSWMVARRVLGPMPAFG